MTSVAMDDLEPTNEQRIGPTLWRERYLILASIVVIVVLVAAYAFTTTDTSAVARPSRHDKHAHAGRRQHPRRHRSSFVAVVRPDPRGHLARGARRVAAITGRRYYVSRSGSDSNSGTSPSQPWRTVGRVNGARLRPGDGVLFEGGQTFSGATLRPGSSGAAGRPIVFGSYGKDQATITQGVWFIDHDYLTFDNLSLGPQSGLQGGNNSGHTASHIVVQRCTISLGASNPRVGIYSNGNDWTIADNTVEDIGNSGMLLNGDTDTISGNTITNVGLDRSISYGKHGIYLIVSNATVTNNNISHFQADGISPRLPNSTISGNIISDGPIGIGFFEYDTTAGTSHWTNNTITGTTAAGIYVNGGSGGLHPTIERFVISGNTIDPAAGQRLNLERMRGTYRLQDNRS